MSVTIVFGGTFFTGMMGLIFHRSHLLSALLCLETVMLGLFIGLSLWTLHHESTTSYAAPILVLTFSACEAAAGLALLVATTRTHGTDQIKALNLLQC
uniref:NADH-ubiquinone oxidoreductase chain 4L n=2 Tax=Pareuchiloglanis TaxID=221671 RepID=A0A0R7FJ47_9TELE|nr:NADH dehydrogenase subunit 4L [Pareuchiloglanis anteanalis]YP_010294918.1 NADH dehydrogenase subunit 4L [Pareuchiloglanis feae]AKO72137.1 NADH dehydrogenase subunit 4L [Pareuchiloglanis anteanalis]AKO72176.1 NADH dehydrogenase subunit 4L [Pareuchiloglanis sinensis]UMO90856.1 NADH dehydrogenase subunit 4L [Pareuchiloglanis feae]